MKRPENMLEVQELAFRYPQISGGFELGPISMTLKPGQLVAWIGHNGSGKTTLARLLCGELTMQSGKVICSPGTCTYYHQSPDENVFRELQASQHVKLLAGAHVGRWQSLTDEFSELQEMATKYPDELSGGQLQLLAFATAILRKSRHLFLDELLNNLDYHIAERIVNYIRTELVAKEHLLCVIITHDLRMACKYADAICVFQDGRVSHHLSREQFVDDEKILANLLIH